MGEEANEALHRTMSVSTPCCFYGTQRDDKYMDPDRNGYLFQQCFLQPQLLATLMHKKTTTEDEAKSTSA